VGIEAISGKFTNFRLEGRKLRAQHAIELGQVRLKHCEKVGKSGGGWWRADGWHEMEAYARRKTAGYHFKIQNGCSDQQPFAIVPCPLFLRERPVFGLGQER
jgi:hypothetical protein